MYKSVQPNIWVLKRFQEISKPTNGIVDGPFGSDLKVSDYIDDTEQGIPVLTTKNLTGDYSPKSVRYISQDKFEQLKRSAVFPGDILVAKIGSIGKCCIYPLGSKTAMIPANLLKITLLESMNSKFVYYYISSFGFQRILKSISTATAQPAFNVTKFRNLTIPTPPLPEQERIVARIEELFSELDKGVEALQTIKAQLKVYRQAVLKEAFEPKSSWVLKTSAEIGEVNLGRQRSPKNVSNNYPTKYIRAANITEQGLDLSDLLEMEFTPSERQKYTLVQGDIVLSEASGSIRQVGKPAIWKNEIEGCCFQNTVIRHRVNGANPQYVFWYYKYCYVSGLFSKIVGGVGINHIGAKNFSELVVPLAPREEQNRLVTEIESRLSVCDKIEQTVDESLAKAESLRQSILKKAFEGRL